jgi:hypothetical protein
VERFAFKFSIFLLAVYVLSYFLYIKVNKICNSEFVICDKPGWIQTKHAQRYEFAVSGSSRALNNIDNRVIDDSLKCNSINIATSGGGYAENYITLYNFLKNGNSVRNLLLQVDGYNLTGTAFARSFNEQYYMHLMHDDTISAVIKDHVNILKYYCWKFFPISRYMEYNFRYSFYKLFKGGYDCDSYAYDTLKGYEPLPSQAMKIRSDSVTFTIAERESLYLNKIISLCISARINVVLFMSPEFVTAINNQKNKPEIDAYYRGLAKSHNITFVSNVEFSDINRNVNYFSDITHLNDSGAKVFARQLITYVRPLLFNSMTAQSGIH